MRRLVVPVGTKGASRWEPMIKLKQPHEVVERETDHAFIENFDPKPGQVFGIRAQAEKAYDEAAEDPLTLQRLARQVEALASLTFGRPVPVSQPPPEAAKGKGRGAAAKDGEPEVGDVQDS